MPIKIAINGFGRIGRVSFKALIDDHPDLELAAVNDLTDIQTLAYLLKYDSVYGLYDKEIKVEKGAFLVDGKQIKIFSEASPSDLPWKRLKIDIVLECTGVFRDRQGAGKHIKAGAKRVIISAPSKEDDVPSFILGVNEDKFDLKKDRICDMSSCTTNCLAPIVKVLNENLGIVSGLMTTIHSYTSSQKLLDLPHKDLRRGRAAGLNIVPTTTGAAKGIGEVIPEVGDKMDGIALRVPSPVVSMVDLTCQVKNPMSAEKVNDLFEKASQKELKGILAVSREPLVSSDYKGNKFSAVIDAEMTRVIGQTVKVLAWYDNEWAYGHRLVELAEYIGRKI